MPQQIEPLISVIIPTYNREKFLKRAIDSVLNQTYRNIEIIVIDDCSTDNTPNGLRDYFKHNKVKYIRHENNKGAQVARNTGIKIAKGEWIAFLDSDDEWLPQRLEEELSLAYKKDVTVVHSECYMKSSNKNELKKFGIPHMSGDIFVDLLRHPGPMFQGLLVKRKCLEHIGYLDEGIRSYQEWDTAIRLARHYKFGFVENPLFIYHSHEDKTISEDMKRDADGWAQTVEKYLKDILEFAGENALQQHYIILARKYNSVGEFEMSLIYYHRLLKIQTNFWKRKYILHSFLAKKHINPNILDFPNILFRNICRRIKRLSLSIIDRWDITMK